MLSIPTRSLGARGLQDIQADGRTNEEKESVRSYKEEPRLFSQKKERGSETPAGVL